MTKTTNAQLPHGAPQAEVAEGPDYRSAIQQGTCQIEEGQARDSRALGQIAQSFKELDNMSSAEGGVQQPVILDSTTGARSHQTTEPPPLTEDAAIPGHVSSVRALVEAARQEDGQSERTGVTLGAATNSRFGVSERPRQGPIFPSSEIARDRIVRQIPASFSGVAHQPVPRISEFPSVASTASSLPYPSLAGWRADSTGIWPAPIIDTNTIKKERVQVTPLPEVYRHHSHVNDYNLNLSARHRVGTRQRSPPSASEMDTNMSENADSNQQTPAAAVAAADSLEVRRMADTDAEEVYWSGFEDGITYERQRQTLEIRARRSDYQGRANSFGADGAAERQHGSPVNSFRAYRTDEETGFDRSQPPVASHLAGYVSKPSYVEGSHNFTSRAPGAEGARTMTERDAAPNIGAEHHRSAEAGREPHSWLSQPVNNPQRAPDHERWMSPSAFTTNNVPFDRPSGSTSTGSSGGWGKVNMSCNQCRQRKTKCDGAKPYPCTACIKRRTEDECTYAATLRRRGPGKRREGDGEADSVRSDSEVTIMRSSNNEAPQAEDGYDMSRRRDGMDSVSGAGRGKRMRTDSSVDYGVGGSGPRREGWQDGVDNGAAS
ncbi:hypothetical protein QFC21_000904 [Naganishia friedmannii]|uniref:Uncharacterized protein n=1 Tax=Naganishia friedmannii TaxID=89922 RepID=A0ACC2W7Q4_9TREE|nr:hypothetical protein QFC21_000904 [Naganishia friedmannii]